MSQPAEKVTTPAQSPITSERVDPRSYRPLSVKVLLTLHDIHGILVKVRIKQGVHRSTQVVSHPIQWIP